MRTFLLLSLAALALGVSARSPGVEGYISGGVEVQKGEAKYAVEVLYGRFSYSHLCTGALIDKQWVLTTSSCLDSIGWYSTRKYVVGKSSSNPTGKTINEGVVYKHEAYDSKTGLNNIALVQLAEAVPVTPISPLYGIANLPVYNEKPKGHAILTGFDADSKLRKMELQILNATDCSPVGSNSQLVCTEKGHGACKGDDGTPLALPLGSRDWKLVGLASGVFPCEQADKMGQYVDVAQFSDWVLRTIVKFS